MQEQGRAESEARALRAAGDGLRRAERPMPAPLANAGGAVP